MVATPRRRVSNRKRKMQEYLQSHRFFNLILFIYYSKFYLSHVFLGFVIIIREFLRRWLQLLVEGCPIGAWNIDTFSRDRTALRIVRRRTRSRRNFSGHE